MPNGGNGWRATAFNSLLLAGLIGALSMLYHIQTILDMRNELYFTPMLNDDKTIVANQTTILARVASVEEHLSNVDGRTAIHREENLSLNNAQLKRLDDIYGLLQWSLESRAKSLPPKRAKR
jgi:hypothetical protein